jgi:hypothetical protein
LYNNAVNLSWTVFNETGISNFRVEKSNNATTWTEIATVDMAENSSANNNYSFTDESPQTGANYYRLLIRQNDGRFSFSDIKSIMLTSNAIISVFPNPARGMLNLSFGQTNSLVWIRLIDPSGQVLKSAKVLVTPGTILSFNTSGYAPGGYIIQAATTDGAIQNAKVMINH